MMMAARYFMRSCYPPLRVLPTALAVDDYLVPQSLHVEVALLEKSSTFCK